MKFFTLLFLAVLSAIILIGCERQLLSPVAPIDPLQTTTQFAQKALSDLADTAAERGFAALANAANEVAEILAIEDSISVNPTYPRIVGLARTATVLAQEFVKAGCEVELQEFGEASVNAVKAYTIRDAEDMEQALQNLAQEAVTAEKLLQQLPTNDTFIPFAFGYDSIPYGDDYLTDQILIGYDATIRPVAETRTAVIEFLTLKGYMVLHVMRPSWSDEIVEILSLDVVVDPFFLAGGLIETPGVTFVESGYDPPVAPAIDIPLPPNIVIASRIIRQVRTRYNKAWCQGNFDIIGSILIEESGLDFFDYAFVRNLADIYAEENPETAERIQTNRFPLRSTAITFLEIYFQDSEKTLDEIIELFRQSVRNGQVSMLSIW